ncbi:MAG: 5'-nucleotidase [Gammaproteobacteria bacterium]|jgi:5'-nucleotidase
MKRILISNDDGYLAPGLAALELACQKWANITVVAPERNRSGASNSLTLDSPLRLNRAGSGYWYVDGTPTDCVHLAITGLMTDPPDMVIAGINAGPNLGDDVLYSGTVAAAMEGRFLGFPAIAVSLAGSPPVNYESAARVVSDLIGYLKSNPLPSDTILNINVPDVTYQEMQGFCATRLGHRHKSEPVVKQLDPTGREIYWVGPPGPEQDAGEGTDFSAIKENKISVTPIKVDLTKHEQREELSCWLEELN